MNPGPEQGLVGVDVSDPGDDAAVHQHGLDGQLASARLAKQIPTIHHLKDQDTVLIGRMIQVAKDIARQEPELKVGYRLVFNCGEKSGQEVFHIHLHLLGGRQMNWPPG